MKYAWSFIFVGFVALASSFSWDARADVVGPPPDECPDGTQGTACHGGPFCQPIDCMTDADCSSGLVCKDKPLCVSSIICAGLLPPDASLEDYKVAKIDGQCPNGNECAADATCTTRKVCVPVDTSSSGSSSSASPGNESGCTCRAAVGETDPAWGAWISLGIAAIAASARRRQRSESRQRRS